MKQEVVELVYHALGEKLPMLELRGGDCLARAGGDLDILVPSRQAVTACVLLAGAARNSGWYLGNFRNIGYLAQLVLVRPGRESDDESIKVDFFAGLEWYGVGSDVVSQRLFRIVQSSAPSVAARRQWAAGVNFIQKCLTNGQLGERDWERVVAGGASPEFLLDFSRALGLELTRIDIDNRGVRGLRKWRIRAGSAGAVGSVGMFLWFMKAAYAHCAFKLGFGSEAGHVVGLSGLDGSGKSTQMDRLFAAYRQAGGIQPRLVHLLPDWIPLPHKLLRRKQTAQNYTTPYAEAPVKSKWSALLRLAYYLMAFAVAKCWIQMSARRGQLIVLDRSFVDFAADLTRSRIPNLGLPRWLIRRLTPAGLLFYLDASPETVVRRKGELTLEKATELRERYLDVVACVGGKVISAEGTPTEVYVRIMQQLDRVLFERLSKTAAARRD